MEQEKKLAISKDLEDMEFETTIFPENFDDFGVAIFSEIQNTSHTLRIIQLLLDKDEDAYYPVQELAAFSFEEREDLTSFIEDLPELNGIEMLMLLNPLSQTENDMYN